MNFSFIGPLILDCATDCRRQRVIAGFLFAYCLDLAGKYLVAEVAKDVPIQRYHSLKQRAVNSDNHSAVANNASVFLLFAHRCRYFFKQRIFLFRVRIRLRLGLQKLTMARLVAAECSLYQVHCWRDYLWVGCCTKSRLWLPCLGEVRLWTPYRC